MSRISHRPVASDERQICSEFQADSASWEDLRVFLVCAKAASFRKAARELGINQSTVTRRIDRLEQSYSQTLFNRLPEGITLTAAGQQVAECARAMEAAYFEFAPGRTLASHTDHCRVSVAVTEGLGSFWVMPRLVEFQREHPNIAIDLYCGMEAVDVLRLEADFAVQLTRPTRSDVVVQRLGKFHLYPFAAQSYIDMYGVPKNAEQVQHHRFVQQITPNLDNSAFAAYFGLRNPDRSIAVRTNTSTAHLYAIEKGAGIGGLPNFAAALGAPVVPVDIGSGYSLDIWLTSHADTRKSRHKAIALDWLKSIFDAKAYRWFGDEMIHPNQLLELIRPNSSVNDGRGYLAANPTSGLGSLST